MNVERGTWKERAGVSKNVPAHILAGERPIRCSGSGSVYTRLGLWVSESRHFTFVRSDYRPKVTKGWISSGFHTKCEGHPSTFHVPRSTFILHSVAQ